MYQFQIMEVKKITYRRIKHRANGVYVCPKKEQLSNLLHDLLKDELVIMMVVNFEKTRTFMGHAYLPSFTYDFRNVFGLLDF